MHDEMLAEHSMQARAQEVQPVESPAPLPSQAQCGTLMDPPPIPPEQFGLDLTGSRHEARAERRAHGMQTGNFDD